MLNRKKILYFGLDPSRYESNEEIIHFPLIETRPLPYERVKFYFTSPHSHLLFTSRTAVSYYFGYGGRGDKICLCVGKATAQRLAEFGVEAAHVAKEACGEGVIALLERLACEHILYPHSARARPLLPDYLKAKGTPFALYDTFSKDVKLPNLEGFDRLVFTSPSTVEAFATLSAKLPERAQCEAIGPVTQNALNKLFDSTILRPDKL
ncbi:MAG: uroporphyrinogen-III synthase [Chlamydiales bacterium]|nr:uroporphyrinogen-III synthase [Chlamydiales bacterium]